MLTYFITFPQHQSKSGFSAFMLRSIYLGRGFNFTSNSIELCMEFIYLGKARSMEGGCIQYDRDHLSAGGPQKEALDLFDVVDGPDVVNAWQMQVKKYANPQSIV